jgi:beta-glucosidase
VNPTCIVILVGGSAIIMEEWKNMVPVILISWYCGMQGGNALANIVFGKVNPSGKLPFTIPKNTANLPFFDKNVDEIEYGYYHGYTKFDKEGLEPAFPFGFGLSYTQYKYDNLKLEITADSLIVTVEVSNIGKYAGEEIVQLYVGFENSTIERPKKLLKGFTRVSLQPDEKKQVKIKVNKNNLAWYNPEKKNWELENIDYTLYVGRSSKNQDLLRSRFRLR